MSDLEERLRAPMPRHLFFPLADALCMEAADRISTLEAENATLRIGVKRLSDEEELCAETTGDDPFSLVYLAAAASRREKELVDMLRQSDDSRVAQNHRAMSAEEENATLEAELQKAIEALEPFAKAADAHLMSVCEDMADIDLVDDDNYTIATIKVSSFRYARKVLRAIQDKEARE